MTDEELRAKLQEWRAPDPSPGLRSRIFGEGREPWWRMSIRIPVPLAACLAIALALGAWRWITPRTEAPTERVEVPAGRAASAFSTLHPVDEFRPRIIKGMHVSD